MTFDIMPDDTLESCLTRIAGCADAREPLVQFMAKVLLQLGTGTPSPSGADSTVPGPPGPPGLGIIMVADRNAVLAYPQSLGILLQSQADGKLYHVQNFQWMEITGNPA